MCLRLSNDLRLTSENKLYFIEANPNPILADDEDFALAAGKAGLSYPQLIERIVRQGMKTVRLKKENVQRSTPIKREQASNLQ